MTKPKTVRVKSVDRARFDNWASLLTGTGTSRDKLTSYTYGRRGDMSSSQVSALWEADDMAARVVETLPDEAMRAGFEIESDVIEVAGVRDYLETIDAETKIQEAWHAGRAYGGAVAWMIVDDGQAPTEPLDVERVKRLIGLRVFDRHELRAMKFYDDPLHPQYGDPELWQVVPRGDGKSTAIGGVIHETRALRFSGAARGRDRRVGKDGWGMSVLHRTEEPIKLFQLAWQSLGHLMQDSSQSVFKIHGLIDALASGNEDAIRTRMELIDVSRSNVRAVAIDAEGEDLTRAAHGLSGLEKITEAFGQRLAAAAQVPLTFLMGTSPAGLNATGESDVRQFYDRVAVAQQKTLRPQLERLVRVVLNAADGPTRGQEPETWAIKFNPLRQMSEAETADLRGKVAASDVAYINAGVLSADEVALNRFGKGEWSMSTSIDVESRQLAIEADAEPQAQ